MCKENKVYQFLSVIPAFFAMGAVDLIGIASNHIKADFQLTDTLANALSFMVFFWFLIFSVPAGLWINRIGRQKMVLLSLIITAVALIVPVIEYTFLMMFLSFSLLGIGNTLMQVSLNPLLSNIVSGDRLPGSIALGQLIKTIAAFFAPLIAGWAALYIGDWKVLFPVYAIITFLSFLLLNTVDIRELSDVSRGSSFTDSFRLLGKVPVVLYFMGIVAHVGIDAGINIIAPRILMERIYGMTLNDAGFVISLYFLSRIIGSFSGVFILKYFSIHRFFIVSIVCLGLSVSGLLVFSGPVMLYICVILAGLGNSNVFSMIFSKALQFMPVRGNEISGLMIMGISGGAIFPLLMGIGSDFCESQSGALIILIIPILYLFFLARFVRK